MRILQIHKYFSKLKGGGSVSAFFELIHLLKKKGEEVLIFSMQDDSNEPSNESQYFINNFDLNKINGIFGKIKIIPKVIWNREAQNKLEKLIAEKKPDVAHLHNIYHYLTPSIIHTLKKHNIPVVFKLSDYKVICPNYKLFNRGKICEKCQGGKYYNCFLNQCLKNSYFVSFLAMIEAYLHKFFKSYEKVDIFIAPSEFMKDKCVKFGIPENKIKVLRNPINQENFEIEEDFNEQNYFLCYGRISEEKGIKILIQAVNLLRKRNKLNGNKLIIVGEGPEKKELLDLINDLEINDYIQLIGLKKGNELKKIIRNSKFVALPSVWFDNSPMIVSESQMLEKPVIVSDSGGTKEMIIENKSGFIFKAGDANSLADSIERILNLTSEERRKMGQLGRENAQKINNPDDFYLKLKKIYTELLNPTR